MSLRSKLNALVSLLMLIFVALVLSQQLISARKSIREEMVAGNVVATRLFNALLAQQEVLTLAQMDLFLSRLGRLRATELRLLDADSRLLYRSPDATYKAGREAPRWFADRVAPEGMLSSFVLADGLLTVESAPSRAVLDAWDDWRRLALIALGALLLAQLLLWWLLGRATRPLRQIVSGLQQMQQGDFHTRLPPLAGRDAAQIGSAFNQMAQSLEEHIALRQQAAEAAHALRRSRETAQLIEQRLEDERRQIARELHDETSQSVTAIRALALGLSRMTQEPALREAAELISRTAASLHAEVHDLIPRLRPLALDNLGLADALRHQLGEWQSQHPQIQFALDIDGELTSGDPAALAAFRIVQEAVSNALRHAAAHRIGVQMRCDLHQLQLVVVDDGIGMPADWAQRQRYGVLGMQERAEALGGELCIESADPGTRIAARLPLGGATA